ncbi:copper amine oxidase N-terminal domain-containing protein [Moorella naiadis]|uniref:copper amine oxidase N-terminal domain-containing protein n=1 Tax=Moorella naiadis (nom. illeg.) TaxID=3093670 RepID=UPI003D9C8BFE
MRKTALSLLLIITLFLTPAPPIYAAGGTYASFTIDQYNYTVNGLEIPADAAPLLLNNRAYVPIRYLARALGVATDNIFWNEATGTVTLVKVVGSRAIYINLALNNQALTVINQDEGHDVQVVVAKTVPMDVAPVLIKGRVYLPARYVAEALGYTVSWDEQKQAVYITSSASEDEGQNTAPQVPLDQGLKKDFQWVYDKQKYQWQISEPSFLVAYNQRLEKTLADWNNLDFYGQTMARQGLPAEGNEFLDAVFNASEGDFRPWVEEKINLDYTGALAGELDRKARTEGYDRFQKAEFILSFVQSLPYVYTPLPRLAAETLFNGGDCKSKSILLASLLHHLGYQVILLEFPPEEFANSIGHEAVAVAFNKDELPADRNLFSFDYNGQRYYYAETTAAGWELGAMPELLRNKKATLFPLEF